MQRFSKIDISRLQSMRQRDLLPAPFLGTQPDADARASSETMQLLVNSIYCPIRTKQQPPSAEDHQCAPDQKADVPIDPLLLRHGLVDVVKSQDMMVDDAFNQIENAESHQHGCWQQLSRPSDVLLARGAPEDGEASYHEQICAGVENTVPDDIELEAVKSIGGVTGAGQHMMPLQDLMQHDPVEEAAQPQAKKKFLLERENRSC